jgi:hypothetical protein
LSEELSPSAGKGWDIGHLNLVLAVFNPYLVFAGRNIRQTGARDREIPAPAGHQTRTTPPERNLDVYDRVAATVLELSLYLPLLHNPAFES